MRFRVHCCGARMAITIKIRRGRMVCITKSNKAADRLFG